MAKEILDFNPNLIVFGQQMLEPSTILKALNAFPEQQSQQNGFFMNLAMLHGTNFTATELIAPSLSDQSLRIGVSMLQTYENIDEPSIIFQWQSAETGAEVEQMIAIAVAKVTADQVELQHDFVMGDYLAVCKLLADQ